jgi:L-fuconolactonase
MMTAEHPEELLLIEHLQPSSAWLQASQEVALEPTLSIVDAHHHFSEHWGGYFPADLLADGVGHNIGATVYVQCGWGYKDAGPAALRPVGETESVVAITQEINAKQRHTRVAAGIVGYADLRLGDAVDEVLAAHIAAGDGRFRGIRNSGAYHATFKHGVLPRPMPSLYRDAAFRAGYARLAQHGLSFDAWIYHPQIEEVLDLATEFPETTLVLDHIGGVLGVAEYAEQSRRARIEWLPWIRRLAECPNVVVKLGGLGTAVFGHGFAKRAKAPTSQELMEAWRPWFEPVLESFGPQRCMFESNFPVDRSASGYGVVWNAFKRMTEGLCADDRNWLFKETAAKVYRLSLD